MESSIAARLERLEEKIEAACRRSGRKRGEVQLMGITKFRPLAVIEEAWDAGMRLFGESRVQEAVLKFQEFREKKPCGLELHLVGSLQSNKAKK